MPRKLAATVIVTVLLTVATLVLLLEISNRRLATVSAPLPYRPPAEPAAGADPGPEVPRNIVLFIADGFGFSHLALSRHTGFAGERPVWERFPVRGWHDPRAADGPITDSAASATAMATGRPTVGGRIAVDPQGRPLRTVLDDARERGLANGIVTDSYVWDATPAAFVTRAERRSDAERILTQLAAAPLDVLFGELGPIDSRRFPDRRALDGLFARRYVLLDRSLATDGVPADAPLAALLPEQAITALTSRPNLPALTRLALSRLGGRANGFFLVLESEEVDTASHRNDSERLLAGLRTLEVTLEVVLEHAVGTGTLVIFTGDHATGGLSVAYDRSRYPDLELRWSSRRHTAEPVPLFALGPGAGLFGDVTRNWELGRRLRALVAAMGEPPAGAAVPAG